MLTTKLLHVLVAGAAVAGCATGDDGVVTPIIPSGDDIVMGNPRCAEAGARVGLDLGTFAFAVDPGTPGTYRLDDVNRVTLASEDLRVLDWSATVGVDAILVRGGGATQIYVYAPEARDGAGLTAPIDPKTGEPTAITGVEVCYDHELAVTTTAATALTRAYAWTVGVTADQRELYLVAGATEPVRFTTKVAPDGIVDRDFVVAGDIVITNPAPYAAQIVAIGDRIGELKATVTCPELMPFALAPFGRVVCRYSRALPDDATRINRIVVDTVGYEVGRGTAARAIDFDDAKVTELDRRVEVWDDHAGRLGVTATERRYGYRLTVGPYDSCGETLPFTSTASLLGSDSGLIARASATVTVHTICVR